MCLTKYHVVKTIPISIKDNSESFQTPTVYFKYL
jgi:hypothetical protein